MQLDATLQRTAATLPAALGRRCALLGIPSSATGPAMPPARAAPTDGWGQSTAVNGDGGSLPVIGAVRDVPGLKPTLMRLVRDDDNIHAPNEKDGVENIRRGIRSAVRIRTGLTAEAQA